ncbi:MAG: ABC transporter substrate-binding protein, partial [Actinomycetales bacterium]
EITPAGTGRLEGAIPTGRTDPAYDVVAAFGDLTETVDAIDSTRLAAALDAVSDTFEGSGPDVRAAVRGLSRLSRTVASRDTEIRRLLDHSATLTGSLADSRDDVGALVRDASLLLREVDRRREAIDGVVEHSADLSVQLRGLVKDNQATIGPALDDLDTVVTLLRKKQKNLALTVHRLAVFARVFNNTIGSGPWFDSYLGNVPDSVRLEEAP